MVGFCIHIYRAESLQYKVLFIQTNVLTNGNAILWLKFILTSTNSTPSFETDVEIKKNPIEMLSERTRIVCVSKQ